MTTTTATFTTEDIEYAKPAGKPAAAALLPAGGARAVSGGGRAAWRRLASRRPARSRRTGTRRWPSAASPSPRSISGTASKAHIRWAWPTSTTRSAGSSRAPRIWRSAPDLAISGQSSGGHLAMLVAMKPKDPRYAAQALPSAPATDDSRALRRHVVAGHQPALALSHGQAGCSRPATPGPTTSSPGTTSSGAPRPTWRTGAAPSSSSAARRWRRRPRCGSRRRATTCMTTAIPKARSTATSRSALRTPTEGGRRDRPRLFRRAAALHLDRAHLAQGDRRRSTASPPS